MAIWVPIKGCMNTEMDLPTYVSVQPVGWTEMCQWNFSKWFHWIQWPKYMPLKGLEPATSCVRDQDATTVPARYMSGTVSLNWAQFMLQWFIRFPEFNEITEFNESSAPFRKNSIVLYWHEYRKSSNNKDEITLNYTGRERLIWTRLIQSTT